MRPHSRELGLRERSGVLRLGVIGGLLAILMLVVAACDDKEQPTEPTATGESPGTSAPTPTAGGPEVKPSPSSDIELAGETAWILESLDGRPLIEESFATLKVDWRPVRRLRRLQLLRRAIRGRCSHRRCRR